MGPMGDLGVTSGDLHRVVPETRVAEMIGPMISPADAALRRGADGARALLGQWVSQGLPCTERGELRCYDLVEVTNWFKLCGLRGDAVAVESIRKQRGLMCEFPSEEDDRPVHYRLELRREFVRPKLPAGSSTRIHMPLPLDEPRVVRAMHVEPGPPPVPGATLSVLPGRLDARFPFPQHRPERIALSAFVSFTTHLDYGWFKRLPEPSRDPDHDLYLRRDHKQDVQVTPAIVALSHELAGKASHAREAIERFWEFFFRRMRCGQLHYEELDRADPLGSVLQKGWFDCYSGSALLVALCRAHGIPARLVGGWGPRPHVPYGHFSAEAWVDPTGWVPLDIAFSWDLAMGHLEDPWSRHFFGRLDRRVMTFRLPHFSPTAYLGLDRPKRWYQLSTAGESGAFDAIHDAETGEVFFYDFCRVHSSGVDSRSS